MAISYSKQIIGSVTKTIFERGRKYYKSGKVRNLSITNDGVFAVVSGSEDYDVEIGFHKNSFGADCYCAYMENNQNDYCKHIVAVAIARDVKLGLLLPSENELENLTIEEFPHLGKKLSKAFKDPLNADLEVIACATDFSSWVRPHAKIPPISFISLKDANNLALVKKSFNRINSLKNKFHFDSYFCAGEVTAVTCKTLDTILDQFNRVSPLVQREILYETIKFYYQVFLAMIDGSDGVWQIAQARVKKMFKIVEKNSSLADLSNLCLTLNQEIKGWGDVFEDL